MGDIATCVARSWQLTIFTSLYTVFGVLTFASHKDYGNEKMAGLYRPQNERTTRTMATQNKHYPRQETSLKINEDRTATVTGVVLENVRDCAVDLACYLRLRVKQEDVQAIYVAEEGIPCVNSQAATAGSKVAKGQKVTIYGAYSKLGSVHVISTCPAESYYIRVLP